MKLVDLKQPKQSKKELKGEEVPIERDRYPYGAELRFETREVKKLGLENAQVGQTVTVIGLGQIEAMSSSDRLKGEGKNMSVTIQLQKIAVQMKSAVRLSKITGRGGAMNVTLEED